MGEKVKLNSGFYGRPKSGGDWQKGKWGGLRILLLKPYLEAIEDWARKSGMAKASFYRMAFMRGALLMARDMGFAQEFPPLPEDETTATQRGRKPLADFPNATRFYPEKTEQKSPRIP